MIGLTVVGNPAATVSTSSPGRERALPEPGEVSADSASRLADDPELHEDRVPHADERARPRSSDCAKRPAVSQKSSAESTSETTSSASKTRPDTGTGVSPGTNSLARPLLVRVAADEPFDLAPARLGHAPTSGR